MTLLDLIQAAIKEDMPNGDLTTESLALVPRPGRARLMAKQDLVLSGTAPFEQTILYLDSAAKLKWHFEEGERVLKGQIVCTIQGDLVQCLKAERTALNFIMHLSGVATLTRQYADLVKGTGCKILDTRKTTPAYRALEKRAVIHGGGLNHRQNLSTAVLIKDNHIALMGGVSKAVSRLREHCSLPIEIEARTLEEVKECCQLQVHRILLDNMNNDLLKEAVRMIPSPIETEASGNMTLERVAEVAKFGIHYISVGALTHSAPSADLSLKFDWT